MSSHRNQQMRLYFEFGEITSGLKGRPFEAQGNLSYKVRI